ncbi:MAG: ankyrin repeat domain-containing protein [Methylococcaceae bacterium]|nr:ankyrin repeat domain-containing protein [Methylococcaceae bacterium]
MRNYNMTRQLCNAIQKHDRKEVAKLLLEGSDPNVVQLEWPKFTTLQAAIEEIEYGGSMDVISELLKYGADVNRWDGYHDATPLLMAIFRGHLHVVQLLLEAGANPNVRGSEGDSPLRWSVSQEDIEMARLLLKFGANETINEIGQPGGLTALGIAVEQVNVSMIKLLLENGADTERVDEFFGPAQIHLPPLKDFDSHKWHLVMKLISHSNE